jgi:hypothetical protein
MVGANALLKRKATPAPSADHDSIDVLALDSFYDGLRRVTPLYLRRNIQRANSFCSLSGVTENSVGDGIKRSADILFGAGELPHLIARKVSTDS